MRSFPHFFSRHVTQIFVKFHRLFLHRATASIQSCSTATTTTRGPSACWSSGCLCPTSWWASAPLATASWWWSARESLAPSSAITTTHTIVASVIAGLFILFIHVCIILLIIIINYYTFNAFLPLYRIFLFIFFYQFIFDASVSCIRTEEAFWMSDETSSRSQEPVQLPSLNLL